MWLLPVFSSVSFVAARIYYRLVVSGAAVPRKGPVLLVANHPNSLLDPMLVAAAVGRQVRFLAKAPLFTDAKVGWLVRASGSIPVYRRVDDVTVVHQNEDMFRAVVTALREEAVVGIFPEGVSHSEPALADIKTGAARIALGAADAGTPVPIIPIGIVLRRKDRFRSEASVLLGEPVSWNDLYDCKPDNREAVRDLTTRIADGLRRVTVNLAAWADQPLVDCTEAIWSAEHGGDDDEVSRVHRLKITTEILAKIREEPGDRLAPLVQNIVTHCRRLRTLRLTTRDLRIDTGPRRNLIWAARRFYLIGLPAIALGLLGGITFWLPYHVTARITNAVGAPPDRRSTYQLLSGIAIYSLWLVILVVAASVTMSWRIGLLALMLLPFAGLVGLWVRERWRGAWADIQRYLIVRSRRDLIDGLADRQHALAEELSVLFQTYRDA